MNLVSPKPNELDQLFRHLSVFAAVQDFIDRSPTPINESDLFVSRGTASVAQPVDEVDSVFTFGKSPAVAKAVEIVEAVVVDLPVPSSSAPSAKSSSSPQRGFAVKEVWQFSQVLFSCGISCDAAAVGFGQFRSDSR